MSTDPQHWDIFANDYTNSGESWTMSTQQELLNDNLFPDQPSFPLPVSPSSSTTEQPQPPQRPTRKRTRKPGQPPPRPPNSFILFRKEWTKTHQYPSPAETSKKAGEAWHDLPAKEKEVWNMQAALAKEAHAKRYPDYRFEPKRKDRSERERGHSRFPSNASSNQDPRRDALAAEVFYPGRRRSVLQMAEFEEYSRGQRRAPSPEPRYLDSRQLPSGLERRSSSVPPPNIVISDMDGGVNTAFNLPSVPRRRPAPYDLTNRHYERRPAIDLGQPRLPIPPVEDSGPKIDFNFSFPANNNDAQIPASYLPGPGASFGPLEQVSAYHAANGYTTPSTDNSPSMSPSPFPSPQTPEMSVASIATGATAGSFVNTATPMTAGTVDENLCNVGVYPPVVDEQQQQLYLRDYQEGVSLNATSNALALSNAGFAGSAFSLYTQQHQVQERQQQQQAAVIHTPGLPARSAYEYTSTPMLNLQPPAMKSSSSSLQSMIGYNPRPRATSRATDPPSPASMNTGFPLPAGPSVNHNFQSMGMAPQYQAYPAYPLYSQ